jgi:hypothetical protein
MSLLFSNDIKLAPHNQDMILIYPIRSHTHTRTITLTLYHTNIHALTLTLSHTNTHIHTPKNI